MIAWSVTFLLALSGAWILFRALGLGEVLGGVSGDRAQLELIGQRFRELEEALSSGILPEEARWQSFARLAAPWGQLASESLTELRAAGGALVPTLRRLRTLTEEHRGALFRARAKASQALAQALACLALVPVFGGALYALLPGIDEHPWRWLIACVASLLLASLGAIWMLHMASSARWGGLPAGERGSILAAHCAGERFLALVRAGQPVDLAWSKTVTMLEREAPRLARDWGHSVWRAAPEAVLEKSMASGPIGLLTAAGEGIKRAVQVSLLDGRPCTDRIETAMLGLRRDWESLVEKELCLLSTRTLKPLFIFVAPALMGLLLFGVGQVWFEWASGSGGAGLGF